GERSAPFSNLRMADRVPVHSQIENGWGEREALRRRLAAYQAVVRVQASALEQLATHSRAADIADRLSRLAASLREQLSLIDGGDYDQDSPVSPPAGETQASAAPALRTGAAED